MKICVIGNSHTSALALALGTIPVSGNRKFDFYAFAGAGDRRFKFENGRLLPLGKEPSIQTTVARAAADGLDIASFDAMVVSACGLFAARNKNIATNPAEHPLGAACLTNWLNPNRGTWPSGMHLITAGVFDALVEAGIRRDMSIEIADLLARNFRGPLLLQPWPAPSRSVRDDASWFVNVRFGEHAPQAWRDFIKAQYRALQGVTAELGGSCALLPYPTSESLDDGFMDPQLCGTDPWHGNAEYGALVIGQICKALA